MSSKVRMYKDEIDINRSCILIFYKGKTFGDEWNVKWRMEFQSNNELSSVSTKNIKLADEHLAMANTLWNEKKYSEAITAAKEALALKQKSLPPDHPDIKKIQEMIQKAEAKSPSSIPIILNTSNTDNYLCQIQIVNVKVLKNYAEIIVTMKWKEQNINIDKNNIIAAFLFQPKPITNLSSDLFLLGGSFVLETAHDKIMYLLTMEITVKDLTKSTESYGGALMRFMVDKKQTLDFRKNGEYKFYIPIRNDIYTPKIFGNGVLEVALFQDKNLDSSQPKKDNYIQLSNISNTPVDFSIK